MNQVEGPGQVRGDQAVPVGGVEHVEGPLGDVHAGVADEDVDRPEVVEDAGDHGGDALAVGDVAGLDPAAVAGRSEAAADGVELGAVAADQGDAEPGGGQVLGDGAADAAAGPGDQCGPVFHGGCLRR